MRCLAQPPSCIPYITYCNFMGKMNAMNSLNQFASHKWFCARFNVNTGAAMSSGQVVWAGSHSRALLECRLSFSSPSFLFLSFPSPSPTQAQPVLKNTCVLRPPVFQTTSPPPPPPPPKHTPVPCLHWLRRPGMKLDSLEIGLYSHYENYRSF